VRPSQVPEERSSAAPASRTSVVPRPSTKPEKSSGRASQAPSPNPPVVRAVVLPPMLDVPAAGGRQAADSEAELAPELERDLVPVPKAAAAAIIEPPEALQLELSELHPHQPDAPSTDVAPPPPPQMFLDAAAPAPPEAPMLADRSPASQTNSAAAVDAGSGGVAAVAAFPRAEPAPAAPVPVAEASIGVAAKGPSRILLLALWVVTAAIPAAAVWMLMRSPKPAETVTAAPPPAQYHAEAVQHPVVTPPPVAVPAAAEPSPAGAEAPASAVAAPAASEAAGEPLASEPKTAPEDVVAAAPSTAPTTPVVVETDSSDRVSVLVKTRPEGARILRRGKEIGRTPLTIEIGRGEHRIFEVSMVGFGAKRITLDGAKPEILVNMAVEAKPPTVYLPAPMPTTKYERLQ
jgi:hypothetical protein